MVEGQNLPHLRRLKMSAEGVIVTGPRCWVKLPAWELRIIPIVDALYGVPGGKQNALRCGLVRFCDVFLVCLVLQETALAIKSGIEEIHGWIIRLVLIISPRPQQTRMRAMHVD
jgi:hypothetical protein